MIITSRKITFALRNKNEKNYEIKLKTIKLNNQVKGCSGFIYNPITDLYVYINTDSFRDDLKYMVRYAKDNKDFTGGDNRYGKDFDSYIKLIIKLLDNPKELERDMIMRNKERKEVK